MTTSTKKPEAKLRDGRITATIWKNETETGSIFAVEFERSYKDAEGQYRSSGSFSGTELLKLSRLAAKAYDMIADKTVDA